MYAGVPSESPVPVCVSSIALVIARESPRSINKARELERKIFSGFTSLCRRSRAWA